MEKGSRKRSSSAGSEKMEKVGDRWAKMEGHYLTGQSPHWAVMPMEEGIGSYRRLGTTYRSSLAGTDRLPRNVGI